MTFYLIISIDTEEGFDWSKPFSRTGYSTAPLFEHDFYMTGFYRAYNIKPVSIISYPLLNDYDNQRLLKQYQAHKSYILGTHLHSWVTPPYEEPLSNYNSFANNLSPELEYKKLITLTDKFKEVFQEEPKFYKAGRYGIRDASYQALEELGYQYDLSPYAYRDFRSIQGPDFRHIQNKPFFPINSNNILTIPGTANYIGKLRNNKLFQKIFNNRFLVACKGKSMMAKLNLLNFVPLTPEGTTEAEMKQLTIEQLKQGQIYFHLSYHSSSFSVNGSLYSPSQQAIIELSERLKNYLHFFQEIGGNFMMLDDYYDLKKNLDNGKKNQNSTCQAENIYV